MEDDYYTVGQAARLLEVGEARVRQMLRKGQLEGDVERERKRADEERKRADEERERADRLEDRAEQVRDELEAERSKGFWSRLFGA